MVEDSEPLEEIELSAVVCDYRYRNIADSFEFVLKESKAAKLAGVVLSAGTHAMKDWLLRQAVNTKLTAAKIKQELNKKLEKQCRIEDILMYTKEDGSMEIKVDISDYQYEEIFAFHIKQFAKSRNVYLRELLPLCLRQFDKTIADEEKTRLLAGILDNLPDNILLELAGVLEKKTGISLKIASLGCKVEGE